MAKRLSVWLILISLVVSTQAVGLPLQNSDLLTISDVFNLETASDPQISPDGSKIVYVRQFADIMTDKYYSNLWVINFDGSDHRPLTTGHQRDSEPRWSPDGKRLAFISDLDGTTQIYLRWMDTGQVSKLTNLQHNPSRLSWSPDGKQIAFSALVPGKGPDLISLPPAPKGAKWAKPAKEIDRLVYRFNGRGYLPQGFTHIFVVSAEGGTPRQITSGDYYHGGAPFSRGQGQPEWTPDGKSIIISANRRDDADLEPLDSEVYEFAVEDGTVRALTNRKGPDNEATVSPDGKHIAYTGYGDRYQGYQVTKLYLMNRDGSNSRVLTPELDRRVQNPQWSPDSRGVYFRYDDQGNTKLGYVSLSGQISEAADNLGSRITSYASGDFDIGPRGRFVIAHARADNPPDISVGEFKKKNLRQITHVNRDLLAHKSIGELEEIWYESSHDGRKMHGWIIKPPHFDASKKYPLILEIHGGPFANYGPRFDFEKQYMASRGYVVFYANPRGSTSYGEEFGNLIHHAYPGDDFYDLNSGVDAVIAKGYIDEEEVFVTGGSGGGVLTCWMIGRSDRWRAAVTVYPVINWYSFVLTADISAFVAKYWFPGYPWDHVEHYESRSLLSVVKNVKTPTMVLTGEEDYRTPMSESEQYYQALKLLGVESVLVRVPDEPHGIRRYPSHWMAKVLYITEWFEKHRKTAAGEKTD
ncbi:S9 family peptidase [bacterium]|nr:S9 family peptidase [bacterium]